MRQMAGILIRDRGVHRRHRRGSVRWQPGTRSHPASRVNSRALAAYAGSSSSSSPYSFSVEPQPAALVIMASKPPSATRRYCAAPALRASSRKPACTCSAPQQPWPAGIATSQPFFCSTRTVASFNRANQTLAMHPAMNATRWRRSPSAGKRLADLAEEERRLGGRRKLRHVAQLSQQFQQAQRRAPAAAVRCPGRDTACAPAAVSSAGERSSWPKTKPRTTRGGRARSAVRFDFGARGFHQPAVVHARRAGASQPRQARHNSMCSM